MASFYKSVTKGTTVDLYINILSSLQKNPVGQKHELEISSLISNFKTIRKSSDIIGLISKLQCRGKGEAGYPTKEELQIKDEYDKSFKTAQIKLGNILDKVLGKEKSGKIYTSFHIAEKAYTGNKQAYIKIVIDILEAQLEKNSYAVKSA